MNIPMILGVLLAVAVTIAGFLFEKILDLNADLEVAQKKITGLETSIDEHRDAIQDLELQRVEDQGNLQRINDQMIEINRDLLEERANYDRLRSTMDATTIDNPELAARAARIGISSSMRNAQCITGGGLCPEDDSRPAADPAAAGAGVSPGSTGSGADDSGDSRTVD